MSNVIELKVPDIGGNSNVDVIDVQIKVGDTIKVEDTLVTLETDKATMDVPASQGGVVKEVKVKTGDKVSEGTVLALIESAAAVAAAPVASAPAPVAASPAPVASAAAVIEVKVPDVGNFSNIPVIEIAVKVGDIVKVDDTLVLLESDKATMDVPSPVAGTVQEIKVKLGDKVSEGTVIVLIQGSAATPVAAAPAAVAPSTQAPAPLATAAPAPVQSRLGLIDEAAFRMAHASPSVRQLARQLGVDLSKVQGSGPKNRITRADVDAFLKAAQAPAPSAAAAASGTGVGLELLPWPNVDFAKFGPVEVKPLSRIKKISGANLTRNWVMIPHVTFNDDADVTELEAFRKATAAELEKEGVKVSPLAFIIKAAAATLKAFPEFNSSLDGDNLVLKQYYHIGFAADTPNGLVVPVIRDVDQKGIKQIARELADLSKLARDGKLKPTDMQGATFTISSLGGIGGTGFTPIINAPEVAILGVCKSQMKPVWNGKEFEPRLLCPLSLSFDHRVLDGAAAARFTVYLAKLLGDVRRLLL